MIISIRQKELVFQVDLHCKINSTFKSTYYMPEEKYSAALINIIGNMHWHVAFLMMIELTLDYLLHSH